MLCVDVNVLVDAFRPAAPSHSRVLTWLDEARYDVEPLIVLPEVAAGFICIVTNKRVWTDPSPVDSACDFVEALLSSPATEIQAGGSGRLATFLRIARDLELSGNDVQDAFLAASALELDATFVTSDRGFSRFRALRLLHP